MDILLIQYGTLQNHTTEEARSRFLAPVSILPITARITEFLNIHQIFNRLVAQFGSSIQNTPESLMNGRITTRGKIGYHFKTFGALTVVFVEAKLKTGSVEERLNVIAQVIAECDGQHPLNIELAVDFSTWCQTHSLRLEQYAIRY
jgi:hypothetical protein